MRSLAHLVNCCVFCFLTVAASLMFIMRRNMFPINGREQSLVILMNSVLIMYARTHPLCDFILLYSLATAELLSGNTCE